MSNWQLSKCCEKQEIIFLCCYGGYALLTLLFEKTTPLKPMRLLGTFIHEMGHASACWMTGGKVEKIEVYNNEGGVTGYRGGSRCLVIPAGYVGCAFWGGCFVALSGHRIGATVVAGIITAALLISLCYGPNGMVIAITLFFSAINLAFLFVEWFVYHPILEFVTLFYGVFIGWHAVRDIYDDLIVRTAEGSDAVACHQLVPCCMPRCVGVQFWVVAFAFQIVGLYFALVWMVSNN